MTSFEDELATITDAAAEEHPAATGSMLAGLRSQRKARREAQHLDLKVPGLDDPAIFVRFKPADLGKLAAALKTAERSKDKDAIALASAAILIDACLGVFMVDQDGTEVSVDPENPSTNQDDWPKFDPRLGELLADDGELLTKASVVCRALYDNDMALNAACDRLIEWSRTMNEDLDREHAGN